MVNEMSIFDKPCVFCGKKQFKVMKECSGHFVLCLCCGSRGPLAKVDRWAVGGWNSRIGICHEVGGVYENQMELMRRYVYRAEKSKKRGEFVKARCYATLACGYKVAADCLCDFAVPF